MNNWIKMQIQKTRKITLQKSSKPHYQYHRKENYLTYKDLFWLVRNDPDPELMLLFIICSRKSCILASKRLYSVKKGGTEINLTRTSAITQKNAESLRE